MKNFKNSIAIILFSIIFGFAYSNSVPIFYITNVGQEYLCTSCLSQSTSDCKKGADHSEKLEFSSLYKYNSSDFTSCDLNAPDSKLNVEDRIDSKIKELKAYENHLHKITYDIKNKHKTIIQSNDKAAFNYVVIFDYSSTYHQEIIDYGIKLKL